MRIGIGDRLIGSLNYDARAHSGFVSEFRKVASLRRGNKLLSQVEGSLAGENSPNGEYAISVEMIVGDELDTVGQLVSVWSGDEIQGDLSRGVGLNLRRRLISLPVGKVNGVVNGAINREFGDVGETGMIILKTHRKLLVVRGTLQLSIDADSLADIDIEQEIW